VKQAGLLGKGAVALGILVLLAALFLLPLLPVLVAEGSKGRWVKVCLPGQSLWVEYVHSVERTAVRDRLVVSWDGGFILRESRYFSYGAGLPTEGKLGEGELVIEGRATPLQELVFRIFDSSSYVLYVGQSRVELARLAGEGGRVTLRVLRPWQLLRFGS